MSTQTITPQTFTNLSTPSGLQFLNETDSVKVGNFAVEIKPELVQRILDFVNGERFHLTTLVNGHHSFLWTPESENNKRSTIRKILNPDSYQHINSFKILSDYFYQVSQHIMGDTCSGLQIYRHLETRVKISSIDFLQQNKMKFLKQKIRQHLSGQNSFLFAPEYDYEKIDFEDDEYQTLIIDPKIHQGNYGKALFYRKGLHIKEYSQEDICRILKENYSEEILTSYQKFKDRFALVEMEGLILILVHLKSIGSVKDLEKNRDLYNFMCQVKNMFLHTPTIMMGDFNLPLPSEEKGHLGYQTQHLENYQLRDEESWFQWFYRKTRGLFLNDSDDYINKGFTRAVYDSNEVIGKGRTDNGSYNSQVYRRKFYTDRNYNTDQFFLNFPSPIRTEMFPKRSQVPLIPYIGKSLDGSDSHLSDHQILQTHFEFEGVEYQASIFNVLSECCVNPPPLKEGLTEVEINAQEIEYSVLMHDIYKSITMT